MDNKVFVGGGGADYGIRQGLALKYANRLSDLLFVMARTVNLDAGGDVLWVPGKDR